MFEWVYQIPPQFFLQHASTSVYCSMLWKKKKKIIFCFLFSLIPFRHLSPLSPPSLSDIFPLYCPSLVMLVAFFGGGGGWDWWWWGWDRQLLVVEFVFAVEVGCWVKHTDEATTRGCWPLSSLLTLLGGVLFFYFFYFFISFVIGFGGLRIEIFSLGWMWVFVFWFYDEFRGGFGVLGGGFRWWWTMVVGCVVWWPVIRGLGFVLFLLIF